MSLLIQFITYRPFERPVPPPTMGEEPEVTGRSVLDVAVAGSCGATQELAGRQIEDRHGSRARSEDSLREIIALEDNQTGAAALRAESRAHAQEAAPPGRGEQVLIAGGIDAAGRQLEAEH